MCLHRAGRLTHICFGNLKIPFPQYSLGDIILPSVNRVTDLDVLITSDLKPYVLILLQRLLAVFLY